MTHETTLVLLRHGVAEPSSPSGDRDRSLATNAFDGLQRQAARLARFAPIVAIVSDARRTQQTADVVLAGGSDVDRRSDASIYEASVRDLRAVVDAAVSEGVAEAGAVVIIGHNPGLTGLAHEMTGGTFAGVLSPGDGIVCAVDGSGGRLVEHWPAREGD